MERVFIERNSVYTRFPCVTCGGCTDKTNAHPMIESDDGRTLLLCDRCLKSGEDGIRERLLRYAEELENVAADLRKAASEQWEMPSMLQLRWYRAKLSALFYERWPDDFPTRFYKHDITISESDLVIAEREYEEKRAQHEREE